MFSKRFLSYIHQYFLYYFSRTLIILNEPLCFNHEKKTNFLRIVTTFLPSSFFGHKSQQFTPYNFSGVSFLWQFEIIKFFFQSIDIFCRSYYHWNISVDFLSKKKWREQWNMQLSMNFDSHRNLVCIVRESF